MCHSNKTLELYVNHDCVFANASLHCYSAFELWELSDFIFGYSSALTLI